MDTVSTTVQSLPWFVLVRDSGDHTNGLWNHRCRVDVSIASRDDVSALGVSDPTHASSMVR